MKKVGILTFQNANNFGAVYQAYALSETIKKLQTEVSIIDYDSPNMGLKAIQKKQFRDFNDRYLNLQKCDMTNMDMDVVITGSDQVWNIEITGNDVTYFLKNIPTSIKRCSYAASVGLNSEQLGKYLSIYRENLKDFDVISVRESVHIPILADLLNKDDIHANIDPTLLLTGEEYTKNFDLAEKSRDGEYILLFSYIVDHKLIDTVNLLALKTGYKVIAITETPSVYFVSGSSVMQNASPQRWLEYIKNAKMIITESFHGVMLSLVFKKAFYVYTLNRSNVTRILNILDSTGLRDRTLTDIVSVDDISFDIDYSKADAYIEAERNKSVEYLKAMIL